MFKSLLTGAVALALSLAGGAARAKEKITYDYQLDPMFEAALWR